MGKITPEVLATIKQENWDLTTIEGVKYIEAYGKLFNPSAHPFAIYGKLYREELNPELKYTFIKRLHDMLWPQDKLTWHYWTEDRFRTYCEGWRIISWASGASGGKSVDAAKIALIEWTAAPKTTAVVVASTTLTSLKHRIYGYLLSYLRDAAVRVPYTLMRSQPPQILYDRDDEIHCISAMAAAKGSDQDAIKNYIGRHPKGKFLLALDEAPDLDPVILEALPNLEAGKEGSFQCIVIGNSASKHDLHGALSTPKVGWRGVDPSRDKKWETVQPRGVCQFFSCYDSPAIREEDPVKRVALGRFLVTKETLEQKERELGKDSEAFCRFVLGYWKGDGAESDLVMNRELISLFNVSRKAEFSGMRQLMMCGGLDAAFSTGGDSCILQLAILGQDTYGNIVLDFRGEELTFYIKLKMGTTTPIEMQIVHQVLAHLEEYRCPLANTAWDATGQGRALGELARLQAQSLEPPIKIWSTKLKNPKASEIGKAGTGTDLIVKTSLELWTTVADFVVTGQLRGINHKAVEQFTTRMKDRTLKGQREVLESKLAYKKRMGAINPLLAHSPDEADAVALALQAATIKFGFHPGQKVQIPKVDDESLRKYLIFKKEQEMQAEASAKERQMKSPVASFTSDFNPSLMAGGFLIKP